MHRETESNITTELVELVGQYVCAAIREAGISLRSSKVSSTSREFSTAPSLPSRRHSIETPYASISMVSHFIFELI